MWYIDRNIQCSSLNCSIYNYEKDNCVPNGIVLQSYYLMILI